MQGKISTPKVKVSIDQLEDIMTNDQNNQQEYYNNLSKLVLVEKMIIKDQTIKDLKTKLKSSSNPKKHGTIAHEEMLQDYINHNQKSVKVFQMITNKITQIISNFVGSSTDLQQMQEFIRDYKKSYHVQKIKKQFQFRQDSQFNYLQEITVQNACLLDYLNKLIKPIIKQSLDLQNQLSLYKVEIRQLQKKLLNIPKPQPEIKIQVKIQPQPYPELQLFYIYQPQQQIKMLKISNHELILQNKNLSELIKQCQLQKNNLLKSIATTLTQQTINKLYNLNKFDIIEQIKKMAYKIRELEFQKNQIYAKLQNQGEKNRKRFQDLLKSVKQKKIPIQSY